MTGRVDHDDGGGDPSEGVLHVVVIAIVARSVPQLERIVVLTVCTVLRNTVVLHQIKVGRDLFFSTKKP